MKYKYKIGDLVKVVDKYYKCWGHIGQIKYIYTDSYFGSRYGIQFKDNSYNYLYERQIELYNPVLKIFLKDKKKNEI